jgi:hypothetical protein
VIIWLIVALVTWPLIALAVGLFLGRSIAAAESSEPRLNKSSWLPRELPTDQVAPVPHDYQRT